MTSGTLVWVVLLAVIFGACGGFTFILDEINRVVIKKEKRETADNSNLPIQDAVLYDVVVQKAENDMETFLRSSG
jgi:hypothetical protein